MLFDQSQLDAIARALAAGTDDESLTGGEIGQLLVACHMGDFDPGPTVSKWQRVQAAFSAKQRAKGERTAILEFVRQSMKPTMHSTRPHRHEPMRLRVNHALLLAALECDEFGKLSKIEAGNTLNEAQKRANALREAMIRRGAHPEVLRFCSPEWLVDDYFDAVHEVVKSITDRFRSMAGLTWRGAELVGTVLGGDAPRLAINPRSTQSERDEQKGFANLVLGFYGMFRNPASREVYARWSMSRTDAEDLLSVASLIHRKLDAAARATTPAGQR